jgi:hypothetical protein
VTADNPQHVVFIDSRVPDLQDLLSGLQPDEQAFVIDGSSGGLEQIAAILAANNLTNLGSISIVAHGETGELVLGPSLITDGTLADHAAALAAIGASLASGGAIQLYGCDVAQGQAGQQFINDFSAFAGGVQVDAATHIVGSGSLGGSWTLDAVSDAPAVNAAGPTTTDVAPGRAAPDALPATDISLTRLDPDAPPPAAPAPNGSPTNDSPVNPDGLSTTPAATATQSISSAAAAPTVPFTAAALDNFQGQLAAAPTGLGAGLVPATFQTTTSSYTIRDHIVRLGLNYRVGERIGGAAEVDVEILGLRRPIARERRLDAAADRPADAIMAEARRARQRAAGEKPGGSGQRQVLLGASEGGAAGRVPERSARRNPADTSARRAKPRELLLVGQ